MAKIKQALIEHFKVSKNPEQQYSLNPFKVCKHVTFLGWMQYLSAWLCWFMDAYDYFSVSLSVTPLSEYYGRDTTSITTAMTLTLLLRSAGALISGLISDKFGRRNVLVVTMAIIGALSLATAYAKTFSQFLAVRSLYGIGMGAIFGPASSIALESLPTEARGLFSGVFQQGYAVGYLVAAVVNLGFVPGLPDDIGYRGLFYLGAGLSWAAGIIRMFVPESDTFKAAKARKKEQIESGDYQQVSSMTYLREIWKMIKNYWVMIVYCFWVMTLFNFFSHASQDLLTKIFETAKCKTSHDATLLTIIGNVGAVVGGTIAGAVSQKLGRRFTMALFAVIACAFIPLWVIPMGFDYLAAGVFFVQFGVQGAWGVIPIFLQEASPPAYRSLFSGLTYQLGNMVSSASAQIEARAAETRTIVNCSGEVIEDYSTVAGIFVGIIGALIFITALAGKENLGKNIENAKTAGEAGAGDHEDDEVGPLANFDHDRQMKRVGTDSIYSTEKGSVTHNEHV
ncbi:hypothetical protein E3P92_00563 [Wallemia ichthyophaga]|nr:hypothetical protein E3P92_00563 [Wallemia ichthyophaga]TIB60871.1 hypothetical protein E3P78_02954 [Wallemia ichthyophaga]